MYFFNRRACTFLHSDCFCDRYANANIGLAMHLIRWPGSAKKGGCWISSGKSPPFFECLSKHLMMLSSSLTICLKIHRNRGNISSITSMPRLTPLILKYLHNSMDNHGQVFSSLFFLAMLHVWHFLQYTIIPNTFFVLNLIANPCPDRLE